MPNDYFGGSATSRIWKRMQDSFAWITARIGQLTQSESEIKRDLSHLEQTVEDKADKTEIATKLDKPDNPAVGKVLKIKSVNTDGTFVCEWADDATRRYNAGDKIVIPDGVRCSADITSGRKLLVVTVPVANAAGIKAARVTKFYANVCNAGGYCYTSAYVGGGTNYAGLSGVTTEVYPHGECDTIDIHFTSTNAFEYATNNAPCIVRFADAEIEVTEVK